MRLCAHLRWKSFYGARWATRAEMSAAMTRDDTPYSCLHTCQPWGPDDDAAAPERCQPDRSCFEVSDREPPTSVS